MKPVKLNLENSNDYFTREAFKVLRTNIQFCGVDTKVISFTSCEPNEGKTYICVELARAMSEAGLKVLLIDTDMRKSVMASRYSDEKGIIGLSQYLSGMAERDDIIYTAENVGFDLVFSGIFPPNPVELLGSKRFKTFIEEERSNYDYILIDTAPVGIVIDGAVVASICDGAVIVISVGMVSYRFVQHVRQQIEKSGCHVLGVVLNRAYKADSTYSKKYYGKYKGYYYMSEPYQKKAKKYQAAANDNK